MQNFKPMRDFGLEVFFSEWEFTARHHMTASDFESMSVSQLLSLTDYSDQSTAALKNELDNLWLGYTETWGAPDLRQAIAETYDTVKQDEVLCLAGAGEGLYMVARVLLDANDHVIVPTPNYQSAETVPLSVCAVTGVPLHCDNSQGWYIDIDEIRAAIRPNTKLLSLNFPHNPTGLLLSSNDFDSLISLCRQHGIYILCDEVYRGIELNPTHRMPQVCDVYERGISLNVMSKAYGLPGLRIGWLACKDRELLMQLERYKHYLSICNSAPSERLAVIALKARDTIFARNHAILTQNIDLLEELLNDFSGLIDWQRPMGGCVAFPRYTGPGDVEEFCQFLIQQSGVLLLPSSVYMSEVAEVPRDRFRIGLGRDAVVKEGLTAMRHHFQTHFSEYAN